jgi:hypothetical protein
VTGGWRKLHNKELYSLYSSRKYIKNNKVKKDEMGRACSTHWGKYNVYRILVGRPGGKRLLGRLRCKWEDNINRDLSERMRWYELVSCGPG